VHKIPPSPSLSIDIPHDDDKHYITIVLFRYGEIYRGDKKDLDNYIVHLKTLAKHEYLLPTYEIIYNNEFKYKVSIREYVVDKLGFKNKNIINIKLINTIGNYHNYSVILADDINLVYKESYQTCKNDDCYSWRNWLLFYKPPNPKINETRIEILDNMLKDPYIHTMKYTDEINKKNIINMTDIITTYRNTLV